jgi:type I restriction enzyme M protein
MCRGLEDLPLVQPGEVTLGAGGRAVVLEADSDWRPEAHEVPTVSGGADGVRLGDCFALRTGFARYAGDRRLFAEPAADRLLLLRAKNLSPAGGLRTEQDAAFITVGGPMYREASRVQPGEIVFVRVGVGCYGRTALVPAGLTAQADDWIQILTPQRPVDAPGLVSWLNGDEGRAAVRRLSKGVGTLSVSKGSLAELRIPARFVG